MDSPVLVLGVPYRVTSGGSLARVLDFGPGMIVPDGGAYLLGRNPERYPTPEDAFRAWRSYQQPVLALAVGVNLAVLCRTMYQGPDGRDWWRLDQHRTLLLRSLAQYGTYMTHLGQNP
jgi:hypothetical protein